MVSIRFEDGYFHTKIGKSITVVTVGRILLVVMLFGYIGLASATDSGHKNNFLSISQVDKSITILGNVKFLPLKIIQKTWTESFDGNSKFELRFYSVFDEPLSKKNYWQSIPVLDDGKELRVSEWNTADCNIEQAAIYTDYDHKVYLLVSERLLGSSEKILAQDEPEKQKIRVFRLMLNINSEPGLPRAYFSKVREQISNESACGYGEIDRILRKVIQ